LVFLAVSERTFVRIDGIVHQEGDLCKLGNGASFPRMKSVSENMHLW
jgi:hypothetical protein